MYILDKTPSRGKFDPKGIPGTFVGYSENSKAFRVWVPSEKKVRVSRDIKFLNVVNNCSSFEDFYEPHTPIKNTDKPAEARDSRDAHDAFIDGPSRVDLGNDDAAAQGDASIADSFESPSRALEGPSRARSDSLGSPFLGFERRERCVTSDDDESFHGFEPEDNARALDRDRETTSDSDEEFRDAVSCGMATTEIPLKDALSGTNRAEWTRAIHEEIRSLIKNDTWELTEKLTDAKLIGCRTVLRNKCDADGLLVRRKARVVAQGFSQRPGVDFEETFAPVARMESLRMLVAISARLGLQISQLDIVTAYLNGDIDAEVYMKPPDLLRECLMEMACDNEDAALSSKAKRMISTFQNGNVVCKLRKAIYGLRQAGRQWYAKIDSTLREIGLIPTHSDPCVYVDNAVREPTDLLLYVDDIVIASRNTARVREIKNKLKSKFLVKDMGAVSYCLGIEVRQTRDNITLSQQGFIKKILSRFGMTECKPVGTPIEKGTKLEVCSTNEQDESLPYRELIGALMYLSVGTRPDITHAVNYLSQFNNKHDARHWKAAKRVLRYLRGTLDKGLVYRRDDKALIGLADADWGNSELDRRSYTGYSFILSGAAVSWCSRKQKTVALSSTEAEYMCLSEAAKEAIFCITLLKELGCKSLAKVQLFNDNQSAIKLARNPVYHSRSKHIEIRFHFIREAIQRHPIRLDYLPTEEMTADVLTKPLPVAKHNKCIAELGLYNLN